MLAAPFALIDLCAHTSACAACLATHFFAGCLRRVSDLHTVSEKHIRSLLSGPQLKLMRIHGSCIMYTRPKLSFPTCPVFQNMTFPHISYTYLAEDRAKFYANK